MSENSTVEQNPSVLNTTAQYITELSVFVTSPMVEINETVRKFNKMPKLMCLYGPTVLTCIIIIDSP